MQEIIVEKPYQFIPPHRGNWVPTLIQKLRIVDRYLDRFEGITSYEVRGIENLKQALHEQCGVILAPNHCRYADPIAMGWVAREAKVHVFAMASWHLFNQSALQSFAIRMCGGFSVNREGLDRKSIDTAVEILVDGVRPLVVFPEGTVFRTNDQLHPLLDGVAFLARTAARRRSKAGSGRVVILPVAIKYLFQGDLKQTTEPVLLDLEKRLTWDEAKPELGLLDRINRLGEGLFSLKEIQYFGHTQTGSFDQRKEKLIARLLEPLETRLIGRVQAGAVVPRVKQLRTKLVAQLQLAGTSGADRKQIWKGLQDIYVAQQIESYPGGYLDTPTDTRILETVERFEEDVTDRSRIHRPLHTILEVGPPIEADQPRPSRGETDPIMEQLHERLQAMLDQLSGEARMVFEEE